MKYVKIYNEKMQLTGVADIDKNYDKTGYVKCFDKDMKFIGVMDVDTIPESGDDIPYVEMFDENMNFAGAVTADNIRHSDGYLIKLQKDPSTTGSVSGGGRFVEGTEVTVVATPDSEGDYTAFDGWYEGENKVSRNASYTFTVSGARTLVAKFLNPNTVITYTATEKISVGNNFGSAHITSHTFEDGLGMIKFDNSVTSIGDNAFKGCSGLTSIEIPSGVTSIGSNVFNGCSGLASNEIQGGVTSIGSNVFNGCTGLANISVDSNNTKYDSRDNCNAIIETSTNTLKFGCKSTVIPSSVTSIGGSAFYGCSGLTSIEIPSSVTSIGGSAFYGCSGLASVVCNPTTPPTLSSSAFNNNAAGRKIYVPAASVDTYKAASVWSTYADDIEAIPQ